ncbi:hypothetical protein FRB93_011414, partial [Tulasnella sp. JGI-2019a]
AEEKPEGLSLLILALTAALLLFLMCRIWYSILATILSPLRQDKGEQRNDAPSNQVTTFHGVSINVQHDSGPCLSDQPNSELAEANTESSLQEALVAGQDAFDKFLDSQRDVDLDRSIESWRHVLGICPIGHEIHPSILKNLGKLLQTQFDRSSDMGDLGESIRYQQMALSLWPMDHPIRPSSLSNLGNALRTRFDRQGDMADLDESICRYQEALSLHPMGHPDRPDSLNKLGGVLAIRFDHKGDKTDLDESTRLCQEALSLLTTGCANYSDSLNHLDSVLPQIQPSKTVAPMVEATLEGSSGEKVSSEPSTESSLQEALRAGQDAFEQFLASQCDEDLDRSIESWKSVLALCPIGHDIRSSILKNLGKSLQRRFGRNGDMGDLEDSINYQQTALSLLPMGHPIRPNSLRNLGDAFRIRFDRKGDKADLEESTRLCQESLSLTVGCSDDPADFNNLSTAFSQAASDAHKIHWGSEKTGQEGIKWLMTLDSEDLDACIRSFKDTLAVFQNDPKHRLATLLSLCTALDTRFNQRGNMADLEECIRHLQEAATLCPIGHPHRASTLGTLGNRLTLRFGRTGNMADLKESICRQQEALTLFPVGHPGRTLTLNNLGWVLDTRFDHTGNIEDLDDGIRHHREAVALCPIDDPDRGAILNSLGGGLSRRFERTGKMADLEECISHYQEAVTLCPIGEPRRALILINLGMALGTRFEKTGNTVDLDESVRHHQEALTLRQIGHPDRVLTLNNLGNRLNVRFGRTGNMADLEECIRHHREILNLRPIGHPDRASSLSNLGEGLRTRFKQTGNMIDLDDSIRYHKEAVTLCPIGHPDRAPTVSNLANTLASRFEQTGDTADLEESVGHHQEALTLRPTGHPDRAPTLNNLGTGLYTRFKQSGKMADLDESIRHHQEAVTLCPLGHPNRAMIFSNLGVGLDIKFQQTGNMTDLEKSIHLHQEALALRPTDHPDRAASLNNLGEGLGARFKQKGNIVDLEDSIRCLHEAVALCPIGHPDRVLTLNNLGNGLNGRFGWSGNVTDLEASIHYYREAVTPCPIGHPLRVLILNNLGMVLDARFKQTEDAADLEEGIRCHQEAVALCPPDHPRRTLTLSNLSNIFRTRFGWTKNTADLEESIRHRQEALTTCPIGHSERALMLGNLGADLSIRSCWTGSMADLEESIGHIREAVTLHPIGHPDRALALNNLGHILGIRFKLMGNIADLEESIQHYMNIAGQTQSKSDVRLTAAVSWIDAARENGLESVADAYSTYMDVLDRSLLLAASDIPDTHARIRKGKANVTEDATTYAIKKHRLSTAVEIAERGRGLLFTQLGNYRTPLNDLEVVNKGLADRFRALSTALDHFATSFPETTTRLTAPGDEVARNQRMASDWDHTVKEIRQLDGFRDFLGVTPFANLQTAAKDGPVLLINISRDGSYALIITATRDPLSVSLPEATPRAIGELRKTLVGCTRGDTDEPNMDQNLTEMLQDLWAMIVAPIVVQLETTLNLSVGSHIWWMPTSGTWWLPLHAAGPYKSGERNLPDRFVSSYTTTLSSLIRARAGHQPGKRISGPRVLVIAQAEAEGQDPLPNVEAEVALIHQLRAEVTIIEGEDCTKDAVLAGLKDMAWAHFSCHGHQDLAEPFKSHFSLRTADAPLTLLDIIQNDLPQAELAFLSACHSASGDLSTPNETVNLAAGIMFAGFRGAVGTMWAMADEDGPVMAEHFYKYMFRNGPEGVDCRDAAKAMVMGIRELRKRKVPLARWINFVHYGI